MKKILVTYPLPFKGLERLTENFDVTYPKGRVFDREEVVTMLPQYDGILAAGMGVDADMMKYGKKLKIISVYGAGYDRIDVEAATSAGIIVTNTPDAVTESTAEVALALMLAVMRRISECDRRLRLQGNFSWGMMGNLGSNLYGKALGIIGMGRIGKAVAKRAQAFGMKICYYNRRPLHKDIEEELGATYYSLPELLKNADVVSLHTPLTGETHHLIGRRELEMMKPSAFIINTARGSVIDEQALIKHLQKGGLAGAGLDVFEKEPEIPGELLKMDQVVLTPHIGTATLEARIEMTQDACQNIIDYFAGKAPRYIINPGVLK